MADTPATSSNEAPRGASGPPELRTLALGSKLRLAGGITAEVVANPHDAVWVFVRYLSSPDPSRVGSEEMVFAGDVLELLEAP